MGSFIKLVSFLAVCSACVHYSSASADNCETRSYKGITAADVSARSEIQCLGKTHSRAPDYIAAYECCAKRKQNSHCRAACLFEALGIMKADGTWNKVGIIKRQFLDFEPDMGAEISVGILECAAKFSYQPSTDCRSMEKIIACFQDLTLNMCKSTSAILFLNTRALDESALQCQGRTHHIPTLFLDQMIRCGNETSVVRRKLCAWKNLGVVNEDNSLNPKVQENVMHTTFGVKLGTAIINKLNEKLVDSGLFRQLETAGDNNTTEISYEMSFATKQAFFEVCGNILPEDINNL